MEEKINVTMSLLFMSAAIVCLVAFLSFHGCVTADKSDWKVLQEDAYHNRFSYDTKSVERTHACGHGQGLGKFQCLKVSV